MEGVIRGARVLVAVKAYPNPSAKYDETVCTAGLLNGERWVRIYPVSYRFLQDSEKYPKYGWIQLDLERRNDRDFRPESHRPLKGTQEQITVISKIPSTPKGWEERKKYLLQDVYDSMDALISDAYGPKMTSLAVIKPTEIVGIKSEPCERDWSETKKRDEKEQSLPWEELIDEPPIKPVKKVPYEFSAKFLTKDGKLRELMIEDWEIGALYWRCLSRSNGDEAIAVEKVKAKYKKLADENDVYFIMGTTLQWHAKKALNPFVIIGVFYPPPNKQLSLSF